jgi:hypothetical protein
MRLRRFLTALVCLSTLAFAQNVVAGTSTSASGSAGTLVDAGTLVEMEHRSTLQSASAGRIGREAPNPSTMMLFVCGLAGLTAAGGRRPENEGELA